MSLGPAEILVVLVVALVLFGPKRLPEVSRQVGGALRELRKIQDTVQSEVRSVIDDHVGPMHPMSTYEPSTQEPPLADPLPPALTAGEPDVGHEHGHPPATTPDPERPAIDGLTGGSFS